MVYERSNHISERTTDLTLQIMVHDEFDCFVSSLKLLFIAGRRTTRAQFNVRTHDRYHGYCFPTVTDNEGRRSKY